jgi:hypothetical protein
MRGKSPYDFKGWRKPLDLVFLDGVHHNPIFWDDLNFWFWKLKPGGLCCGDDFGRPHKDVIWGVQDFAKAHGLTFFVQGRIWLIPRPPHSPIIPTLFAQRREPEAPLRQVLRIGAAPRRKRRGLSPGPPEEDFPARPPDIGTAPERAAQGTRPAETDAANTGRPGCSDDGLPT